MVLLRYHFPFFFPEIIGSSLLSLFIYLFYQNFLEKMSKLKRKYDSGSGELSTSSPTRHKTSL